jgi:putative flavoprotein involved in K+ transport
MTNNDRGAERFETVIIGGGQAGLATGYHLRRRGRPFVILDAHQRVGDAWRQRWDSLRLFTPARFNGLPGLRFPAPGLSFPTKDEVADYLEAYAARFDLPVRTGVRIDHMDRGGDTYVITSTAGRFEADNVVVASGAHHAPRVPAFTAELDPGIVQLHSSEYRNPAQLRQGATLVVGAGNSGAEIALETSRTHPTSLSGKSVGQLPFKHGPNAARFILPLVRFAGTHVLTLGTPIGRKARPQFLSRGAPLIRTKRKDLAAAGVELVPRTTGVSAGRPVLEDGRLLEVANVIWCTGFRPEFGWIGLDILDDDGLPVHRRGVVPDQPGLYFVGLQFQYAATSDVLPGVGRDADYVAAQIDRLTGNVAIQPTVTRKTTTPKPSKTMRRRRDGSFVLIPAKNSAAANSTTPRT